MDTKLLVSKQEAAARLSCSIRTIEQLITQNQLATKRMGRRVFVVAESLQNFVNTTR